MHYRRAHSVGRIFGGLSLALALAGAGVTASPLDAAAANAAPRSVLGNGPMVTWLRAASVWAPIFAPVSDELRSQVTTGTDGRLTFLLLGNDSRGTGVQRTDAIMIVSVKGNTMTAASFPRDTARILNPFTSNENDYFKGKINTILKQLKQTRTTEEALDAFEYVIEKLLNIEIDFHVMVTMVGFQNLFDQVDPIKVRVNSAIKDTKFWDNPYKQRGAYFPATASNTYELWAWQPGVNPALCDGLWRNYTSPPSNTWCRRAIVFARSRKGKGNSDFKRAGRQQDVVFGAVQAVVGRGTGPLGGLANSAQGQAQQSHLHVSNDLPLTVGSAVDIFNRLSGANQGARVVFGPSTYSARIPGTSSYQLKLTAVRSWAAANLK